MATLLDRRLQQMGLVSSFEPGEPASKEADAQRACALRREALVGRMRPQWGEFMEAWGSSSLHQAARQASGPQRQQVVQAWAECLDAQFVQAAEELSGRAMGDLLVPWVGAAATRRHERLPLAPGALLEQWCAAIDCEDAEDETAFWATLSHQVRGQESQADRRLARAQVGPLSKALAAEVHRRVSALRRSPHGLKFWRLRPASWMEDLMAQPDFVVASARHVFEHTRHWTSHLKGDQAFPALAVGLEAALAPKLRVLPKDVEIVELWLAQAIERALPQVLTEPLATPQVARLVRESLRLDAHAQSLTPDPLLRPAR